MVRRLHFACILAAVIVIAVFAVPSLATAHEGHTHHAPSVEAAAPASSQMQARNGATAHLEAAAAEAVASVAAHNAARSSELGLAGSVTDCASHCCGGSAGMTCCGAALAPDPFFVQPFRASVPFLIPLELPTSGVLPEALPKPPKSSA